MSERWRRELGRLSELRPSDRLLEQARLGPSAGVPGPRSRSRLLAAAVAFTLFAGAGFLAWTAFRPTRGVVGGGSTPQVIVTFTTTGPDSELPTAILALGDEAVEGAPGSYCWNGTDKCVDTVAPEFTDFLVVPRGTELVVRGTAERVDGSLGETWDQPGVTLDLADGSATLDAGPSKYVLSFVAHWPQGDVPFFFGIEIIPSADATPSVVSTETPSPSATEAADVGRIACTDEGTLVTTPVVRVRSDGAHVVVEDRVGAGGISVFPEAWVDGVLGQEFARGREVEVVLGVPVGRAKVACNVGERNDSYDELAAAVPIEFVDPVGIWRDDQVACAYEDRVFRESPDYRADASVNPDIGETIRRVIPGILQTDEVSYAGYPEAQRVQWRVVRDGLVIAVIDVLHNGGEWSFAQVVTCQGTGIGAKDGVAAGQVATPYETSGFPRCDPYVQACVPVYVSVALYAELRGEDPAVYGYPLKPSMECTSNGEPFPCTSDPHDVALQLLMSPSDADEFHLANPCGRTAEEMC